MNWSLMLNALLLIGVVVAIVRTVQTRRQQEEKKAAPNLTMNPAQSNFYDDIIAVRKVADNIAIAPKPSISTSSLQRQQATINRSTRSEAQPLVPKLHAVPVSTNEQEISASVQTLTPVEPTESMMMFLLAKSNRQLAGYELLQAVLSAGFRFGEGDLFHRHQHPNCQGPVMCSLAAATPTGTFDLQNIGGFVVHGLCLFMQISGSPDIDAERFDIMLDTARTLSDSLDTYLLDHMREPLSEKSIARYHQRLMLNEEPVSLEYGDISLA